MTKITLPNETVCKTGFTDLILIDFNDLVSTGGASTSATFNLSQYTGGRYLYDKIATKLIAGFVGASVTNLTVKVGWNGGTTDDDDGLLEAVELATAGTEINSTGANGAGFATKLCGYSPQDAGYIQAVFTSTGANHSAMTAGKVGILLARIDLAPLFPSS